MNKLASLTEVFLLLNEGRSVEEVKAQFAGSDANSIDSIAEAMIPLKGLLAVPSLRPGLMSDKPSAAARAALEDWLNEGQERRIGIGQVWAVDNPALMQLSLAAVLDVSDEEDNSLAVIAMISLELDFATSRDLVLSQKESPLGYSFMIEAWHYGTVAPERLVEYQGSLTQEQTDYLLALYLQSTTHDSIQEICSEFELDYRALSSHVGEVSLGSEVQSAFQRRELETHRELWQTGLDALIRHEDTEQEGSKANPEARPGQQIVISQPLLTFTLTPTERPKLALAAASADSQPSARYFEGAQDGVELVSQLHYNRYRGELSLSFPDLSNDLRQRLAAVVVHLKDGSEDVTVNIVLPGEPEERVALLDRTRKRVEDIATLTLTVSG